MEPQADQLGRDTWQAGPVPLATCCSEGAAGSRLAGQQRAVEAEPELARHGGGDDAGT